MADKKRTLPSLLRGEVADRGISQREAAEIVGVKQQTFSRWMNGKLTPSPESIPALARFLHTTQAEVKRLRAEHARAPEDAVIARLEGIERELRSLARAIRESVQRGEE